MNSAKVLLVAVIAASVTSVASADTEVWWEAVPNTPNSLVIDQGPGKTLDLVCDATIPTGRCEWYILMRMWPPGGVGGFYDNKFGGW